MSLIIILPLISADTWFNKDPTIEQMMGNYFALIDGVTNTTIANTTIVNNITTNTTVDAVKAQLLIDIVNSAQ